MTDDHAYLVAVALAACSAAPTAPISSPRPTASAPSRTAARYAACTQAYNARRWDELRSCYAADVLQDEPGTGKPWRGVDEAIDHLRLFVASFPDNTSAPELTLINGTHVVSIVVLRGTNDGPFPGATGPTHRSIGLAMAHLVELDANGGIQTEWILYDTLTMLAQLELLPVPARDRIAATPATVVEAVGDAREARNLAAYRAADGAFNRHDLAQLGAGFADDVVWIEPSLAADLDKPAALARIAETWRGFADLRRTAKTVWSAGDYVVATGELSGTNDGTALGVDHTGKRIAATYIEIVHFAHDRRDRSWLFYNGIVIASQLGLLK